MGIKTIQKEVIETVTKEADEKLKVSYNEAEEIVEKAKTESTEQTQKAKEETEALLKELRSIAELSAKFEVKKLELVAKKDIINNVFTKAEDRIKKLDADTSKRLVEKLLVDAKKELDVAHVICNEKTKKLIPATYNVEAQDMLGGLIAENADRTLRIDNRFETILEDVRKEALNIIAKEIF